MDGNMLDLGQYHVLVTPPQSYYPTDSTCKSSMNPMSTVLYYTKYQSLTSKA